MAVKTSDRNVFAGRVAPEKTAALLVETYGADAASAALINAVTARADARHGDEHFWQIVHAALPPDRDGRKPEYGGAAATAPAPDQPTIGEMLVLVRQFTRIADPAGRSRAIDRVRAIAKR